MSMAPETGFRKGMRLTSIVMSVVVIALLSGCSKTKPPAERAALETNPAASDPSYQPESEPVAIDPNTLQKFDASKLPATIVEQIDKEHISINGASISNEPIDSAHAYQLDLDNNGRKEWIVVYSGPDDSINAIFESVGDDQHEGAQDASEWRDIGAVFGAILKFGPDATDGHINIHTETFNGGGTGKFCDGACDHLLFAWNGQSYENATP